MIYNRILVALIAVLIGTLTACGGKKTAGNVDADVAVNVNGEAITSTELQDKARQFSHLGGTPKMAISGTMIKTTVDMELLRQAAVKEKLDLDKTIRARLAEMNRLILSTAYMEKQLAATSKPSDIEIKAYYDQHPELYAERKQYDLQEVQIQAHPDNVAQIKAKLGDGKKFKEFIRWLGEEKILNTARNMVNSADNMPADMLSKLKGIPVGGAISIDGKDQLKVIYVNAIQMQPVKLEQASPLIEKLLDTKHKQDGMKEMMKQLRDKAKIEYVPPYSAYGYEPPGKQ